MGLGYQIEVNRRFGGEDKHHTEWEFSTRAGPVVERVRQLRALPDPRLVAFYDYFEDGGGTGFCVVEGVEPSFVWALADWLVRLDDAVVPPPLQGVR
jgi:hypothetical protein